MKQIPLSGRSPEPDPELDSRTWQRLLPEGVERGPPWLTVGLRWGRGDQLSSLMRGETGHRLRGGALPQRRRVLGLGHRHVHDPGRHLHPGLRLLRGEERARGGDVDADEPRRVGEAVARMGLRHAVVTSVDRDDLADGGASIFAATIREIRRQSPGTSVEVLTPDFQGDLDAVGTVVERPEIFNHNMETVARLYPRVRPKSGYRSRSPCSAPPRRWRPRPRPRAV